MKFAVIKQKLLEVYHFNVPTYLFRRSVIYRCTSLHHDLARSTLAHLSWPLVK